MCDTTLFSIQVVCMHFSRQALACQGDSTILLLKFALVLRATPHSTHQRAAHCQTIYLYAIRVALIILEVAVHEFFRLHELHHGNALATPAARVSSVRIPVIIHHYILQSPKPPTLLDHRVYDLRATARNDQTFHHLASCPDLNTRHAVPAVHPTATTSQPGVSFLQSVTPPREPAPHPQPRSATAAPDRRVAGNLIRSRRHFGKPGFGHAAKNCNIRGSAGKGSACVGLPRTKGPLCVCMHARQRSASSAPAPPSRSRPTLAPCRRFIQSSPLAVVANVNDVVQPRCSCLLRCPKLVRPNPRRQPVR